ncbi:MAG: Mur ligase family protein [Gammaproteobacteria bacterium]|nr:Mur ligase family protein [Gammaproteobacteria bacterium]
MPVDRTTNSSGESVEALVSKIAQQRSKLARSRSFAEIREIAYDLGLQRVAEKQVVVGGTNGKGSTVGYLQQILSQQGVRVGTTTSPHLHSYLERISLEGVKVEARQCADSIRKVADATSGVPLTYFDLTTLSALSLFRQWEVDVAVIEVGLGGRLDCANVVDNDVAVITNVDLDHTAVLGTSIEEISKEKVGIVRSNKPLVYADSRDNQVVEACAEKHASPVFRIGREFGLVNKDTVFITMNGTQKHYALPSSVIHATKSFGAALQTATLMDLTPNDVALRTMRFSTPVGRLEQGYTRDRNWILDVAHNPAAIRYLRQTLAGKNISECVVVFACFSDKDVKSMFASLTEPLDCDATNAIGIVITDSQGARGMSAVTARRKLENVLNRVQVEPDLEKALSVAASLSDPEVPVVVLGSFDIVSRARRALTMCETVNGVT